MKKMIKRFIKSWLYKKFSRYSSSDYYRKDHHRSHGHHRYKRRGKRSSYSPYSS